MDEKKNYKIELIRSFGSTLVLKEEDIQTAINKALYDYGLANQTTFSPYSALDDEVIVYELLPDGTEVEVYRRD